jgi:hypothetical protein
MHYFDPFFSGNGTLQIRPHMQLLYEDLPTAMLARYGIIAQKNIGRFE